MENNSTFLTKAADLFLEHGAKTLTMDDIAREFGMSKKTLYQKYKNKDALLEDVLTLKLDEIAEKLKILDETVENAIERMFCRDREIEDAIESNQSILIKQLVKYYPAIFNKHMIHFSKKFIDVLTFNIEKGRKQGYYKTDFDANLYAKFFFQLIMSYDNSPLYEAENISRTKFHEETLIFYLNAITTDKGKQILKKISKNNAEVH